ncbi:hypothetical protein [Pseudoduganella sp. R-34]|uniref:hypothetical protein n=1 Tax=unclassified Pseudoduganella TaxID=2637179 RepID=UPI003CE7BDF4
MDIKRPTTTLWPFLLAGALCSGHSVLLHRLAQPSAGSVPRASAAAETAALWSALYPEASIAPHSGGADARDSGELQAQARALRCTVLLSRRPSLAAVQARNAISGTQLPALQ